MDVLSIVQSGVEKPARYLGPEFYPTGKPTPKTGDLMVALGYPDLYEIGMSNTGLRILYSILRREAGVFVDRAFSPWPDMEKWLRESETTWFSRQLQRPLREFDLLGFSLQYELTYSNLLNILDLSGIPLRSEKRTDQDPLVIVGGPCSTHPEPVAPFVDAVLIGDGEEVLVAFVRTLKTLKGAGASRARILEEVAKIDGVYVPSLFEDDNLPVVQKQVVRDIDQYLPFHDFPVPSVETVFDRVSLELARGCQQGCRFCEAGFVYRPPRERSLENLITWANEAIELTGTQELSIASLSTADYSQIKTLVESMQTETKRRNVSLAVSSLRAYGLNEDVLRMLSQSRGSSLTLAPEAGSQRLRDLINKNVTRAQLIRSVDKTTHYGWNRIKLYFMLGLPTETHEDVEEIARLAHDAYDVVKRRFKARAEVVVSISHFVPRPHTPFQWEAMASKEELLDRVNHLRSRLRRKGIRVKWHTIEMSRLEAALTRGDRSLADVIETAWRNGARFDSWEEHLNLKIWNDAFKAHDIDAGKFLVGVEPGEPLPWSHIKTHVAEEYLLKERERALKGKTVKPCEPFTPQGICYHCGADCEGVKQPETAPEPQATPEEEAEARRDSMAKFQAEARKEALLTHRYWIRYKKTGPATLLGHLDVLRHFIFVFRRAGLPLAYSRGFNPRVLLFFPPPLPLGAVGLDERVELALTALAPDDLVERLNRVGLDGIEFLDATPVYWKKPKVSNAQEADFYIAIEAADEAWDALDKVLSGDELAPLVKRLDVDDLASWCPNTPESGERVVGLRWRLIGAKRVDRVLSEKVEGLTIKWLVRRKLHYPPIPPREDPVDQGETTQ